MTGAGLDAGLDWLTTKLNQNHNAPKKSQALSINKLPDHDMKPHLTDLTIEARESVRGLGMTGTIHDLEGGAGADGAIRSRKDANPFEESKR